MPLSSSDFMGHRVLVVDDEAEVRSLLADALGMFGYEVATAVDGLNGLKKLDGVDALLVDLVMPLLDGVGMLKGAYDRGFRGPAYLLTATPKPEHIDPYLARHGLTREYLSRCCTGVIGKPVSLAALAKSLGEGLRAYRPQ